MEDEYKIDWEALQKEIDSATDQPKIEQLENITVLKILENIPEGETWLVCLGRFRVKWSGRDSFQSWWSPKPIWWIGQVQ